MRVQLYGDLRGWTGTARTVAEMHRLVDEGKTDPTVIFLAQQLARRRNKKDMLGQLKEMFDWIRANVHYVRDPNGVEFIRSPLYTIYYRAGDCDDQVILFCALAQAIGFRTRFKTIKASAANPKEYSHVYSQAFVPGYGWVSSDTIVEHAVLGWEAPERFGSQVWEGGIGMMGMGGLGQAAAAPVAAPVKNIWGMLGDVVGNVAIGATQIIGGKFLSDMQGKYGVALSPSPPPTAPAKAGGWLIPIGIGAVALVGVGALVMRKKR